MKSEALKTLSVATILCVVCSILVASSAVLLKPRQDINKALDVKKNLLLASGLIQEPVTKEQIELAYQQIVTEVVHLDSGETAENVDATSFDPEKASKDPKMNKQIELALDIAGIKQRAQHAVVYKYVKEGQLEMLVLPIKGKGLWSTMYGFLALDQDLKTVKGLGFYAHGETPGLGGEIDNPRWKALWSGKKAFGDSFDDITIRVIKGSVDPNQANAVSLVDGLSGATITSVGVSQTVHYWLGQDGFGPYLKKLASQTQLSSDADVTSESEVAPQSSDLEN